MCIMWSLFWNKKKENLNMYIHLYDHRETLKKDTRLFRCTREVGIYWLLFNICLDFLHCNKDKIVSL